MAWQNKHEPSLILSGIIKGPGRYVERMILARLKILFEFTNTKNFAGHLPDSRYVTCVFIADYYKEKTLSVLIMKYSPYNFPT